MKIAQIGVGKLIGDLDAIKSSCYGMTVKWASTTATCLKIPVENFVKILEEVDHLCIQNISKAYNPQSKEEWK